MHPSQLFAWRRNARTDASPQRSAGAGASVRAAAAVVEIIIGDIVVRAGADVAEALRYAISRRAMFERFLTDGRIELDSNIVERAIRPQAITRKNSLFAGSDGGGRTWATIATLLQTAKMNNVDPLAWLIQTLERIANGWPSSEIEALMPWNYAA
ncbi:MULTISPECIES: IS66 family transposase [Sinorhizobium]|uniref:Transposase n=1 Tax=Sinorhizobium kummerowiae TaxID=158892 RepID=A0ABY8TG13_9HYPH|nr:MULTISPECIES: transposase [Sinorhizobium]WHS96712.1 transposase [Sinorhizobium kummerowiae]